MANRVLTIRQMRGNPRRKEQSGSRFRRRLQLQAPGLRPDVGWWHCALSRNFLPALRRGCLFGLGTCELVRGRTIIESRGEPRRGKQNQRLPRSRIFPFRHENRGDRYACLSPDRPGRELIAIAGHQALQGVPRSADWTVPVAGAWLTKLSQSRIPRTVVSSQQPSPASIKTV